jgi:hypothetical protein
MNKKLLSKLYISQYGLFLNNFQIAQQLTPAPGHLVSIFFLNNE